MLVLAPAIGKKGPLEIAGPPRSSSSESTCDLCIGLIDERITDGAAELFTPEGSTVPGIEVDADLEGGITESFGIGGFEVTPRSGPKEDDTLRNVFEKEPKIPDEAESWLIRWFTAACCSPPGPG